MLPQLCGACHVEALNQHILTTWHALERATTAQRPCEAHGDTHVNALQRAASCSCDKTCVWALPNKLGMVVATAIQSLNWAGIEKTNLKKFEAGCTQTNWTSLPELN